ncbi:MAG: ATP-binding protein, partial [Pseudomonadota bacterium]
MAWPAPAPDAPRRAPGEHRAVAEAEAQAESESLDAILTAALGTALERYRAPGDPLQSAPLGLAVSGGSDSLALMVAAARWAASTGRALRVATVDHGLRTAAAAEAAAVAHLAARLGLAH